jgi:hypothetical protein
MGRKADYQREYRKRNGDTLREKERLRSKRRRMVPKTEDEKEHARMLVRKRMRELRAAKLVGSSDSITTPYGSKSAETKAVDRLELMQFMNNVFSLCIHEYIFTAI